MSNPKDTLILCPREGCEYRTRDTEALKRHLVRFHDDPKRNERRAAKVEALSK